MKGTLYAIDSTGKPLARLILAEGADAQDAELFVLRGNVTGARDISEAPELPSPTESENRIAAAVADLTMRPHPEPIKEPEHYAPGSLDESNARISAGIDALDGDGAARDRLRLSGPVLPAITVVKQEPRTDLKPVRESAGGGKPKPARGKRYRSTASGHLIEIRGD